MLRDVSTLNPQHSTLNTQHSTLNPQPSTLNPGAGRRQPSRLDKECLRKLYEFHKQVLPQPTKGGQIVFLIALICTQSRRIPASVNINQRPAKGELIPF